MRPASGSVRESCGQSAAAGLEALDWIRAPANERTVQPQREQLSREFRRHVVECRKLEAATDRPMAVGVFGASQAGKSYLVDRLVSKTGEASGIHFNDLAEPLDFIQHINPAGRTESTAIATRFSLQRVPTPPGFPVAVRLFSLADLVQIIGDIYYTGFDIADEPGLAGEAVEAALEAAAVRRGAGPALQAEDLWTIRDFFERKHRDKANMKSLGAHAFWERAEAIVESTDASGIVSLFSPVWAGVEDLTILFGRFVKALQSLDFADQVFGPLETLVETSGGRPARHGDSIINVSLLDHLLLERPGTAIIVAGRGQVRAPVERALLGGLVSELRLTIAADSWDFLNEADLIDFPGLRPPEVVRDFRSRLADPKLFGRIFKDAKVRFLFERYKNERELNGLILCIAPLVDSVPALPALIEDWILSTHGASPEERAGSEVSLFVVLTKFDEELVGMPGESEAPADRWQNRIKASLLDRLAAQSEWLDDWSPGRPFTNVFWFRNSSMRNPGIMEYESSASSREVGVNRMERGRFEAYRNGYLAAPGVRKYVAEPERAWDEVFRLNDGGLSYIVERLTPVCDGKLKTQQVSGRIAERCRMMRKRLEPFHVATDAGGRMARAIEKANQVVHAFAECAASGQVGRLTAALQVPDTDLADRFAEISRRAALTRPQFSAAEILGQAGIAGHPGASGRSGTLADRLAAGAIELWVDTILAGARDARLRSYLGIGEVEHGMLIEELVAASTRRDLKQTIAAELRGVVDRAAPGHSGLMRAASIAAGRINAFVFHLGFDGVEPGERPRRPGRGATAPVFAPAPYAGIDGLREEPSPGAMQYYPDWITAFGELAKRNAEQIEGTKINVAENERLGAILERLRP